MCPGGAAFRMTTQIPHSGFVLTASRDAIEENVSKRLGLIHNSREQFCWTELQNACAAYTEQTGILLTIFFCLFQMTTWTRWCKAPDIMASE